MMRVWHLIPFEKVKRYFGNRRAPAASELEEFEIAPDLQPTRVAYRSRRRAAEHSRGTV